MILDLSVKKKKKKEEEEVIRRFVKCSHSASELPVLQHLWKSD
jgi:hypothetical protein